MKKLIVLLTATLGLVLTNGTWTATAQPPDTCFGQDITDPSATDVADFLSGTDGPDVIALGEGDDQYFAGPGGDTVCGNSENDLMVGEGGPDQIDGGSGDDTVDGRFGADLLRAGPGADSVFAGGGPDTLISAAPDDTQDDLYDGPGNDTITGNAEDIWHRCDDGATDDHAAFDGIIVPDPACDVTP